MQKKVKTTFKGGYERIIPHSDYIEIAKITPDGKFEQKNYAKTYNGKLTEKNSFNKYTNTIKGLGSNSVKDYVKSKKGYKKVSKFTTASDLSKKKVDGKSVSKLNDRQLDELIKRVDDAIDIQEKKNIELYKKAQKKPYDSSNENWGEWRNGASQMRKLMQFGGELAKERGKRTVEARKMGNKYKRK